MEEGELDRDREVDEIEEWEKWEDWMEEITVPSELYRSIYSEWLKPSQASISFLDELNDSDLDEIAYKACGDYGIARSEIKMALEDRWKEGFLIVMLMDEHWKDISNCDSLFLGILSEFISGRDECGEDGEAIESQGLWTRVVLYLEKKKLLPTEFVALFLLSDTNKLRVNEMMESIGEYTTTAIKLFHLCRMIRLKFEDGELYEKEMKQLRVAKGIIRRLVVLNNECVSNYHKLFWRLKIKKKTMSLPLHPLSSIPLDSTSLQSLEWELSYFFISPSLSLSDLFTRSVNLLSYIDRLIFQDDLLSHILPFFPYLSSTLSSSDLEDCTSRCAFNTLLLLSHIGIFPVGFLTLILHKSHNSLLDSLHPIIKHSVEIQRLLSTNQKNGEMSEMEKNEVFKLCRRMTTDSTAHLYSILFRPAILTMKDYCNEGKESGREIDEWIADQTKWKTMREDKEWRRLSGEIDALNETGAWDLCVNKVRHLSVTFLFRIDCDLLEGRLIPFIISSSPGYKLVTEELIRNPLSSLAYRILMYTLGSNEDGEGIPSLFVYLALRKIVDDESSIDSIIELLTPLLPFLLPRLVRMDGREMRDVSSKASLFVLGSILPSTQQYLRQWPELLSMSYSHYSTINRNSPPLSAPIDDSSFWRENMRILGDRSIPLLRSQIRERSFHFFTALNNNLFEGNLVRELEKWCVNKERLKREQFEDSSCDGCYLVLLSLSLHFFPRGFLYLALKTFQLTKLNSWCEALRGRALRFVHQQNCNEFPHLLLFDGMKERRNEQKRGEDDDLIGMYEELFGVRMGEMDDQRDDEKEDDMEPRLALDDGRIVTLHDFTLLKEWKKRLRDRVIPSLDILLLRSVEIVDELDDEVCKGKLLSMLDPIFKSKNITVTEDSMNESLSGHSMEILNIIDSINVFPPGFIYLMIRDYADETVEAVIDRFTTKTTKDYIAHVVKYYVRSSNGEEEEERLEYEKILRDRLNEIEEIGVDYSQYFPSIDPEIEERVKKSWRKEIKEEKKKDKKRKKKKRKSVEGYEKSQESIGRDGTAVDGKRRKSSCDEWEQLEDEIQILMEPKGLSIEEENDKKHYEKMVHNKFIINASPAIDQLFQVFAIGRNCERQKKWEEKKKAKIEMLTERIEIVFEELRQKQTDMQRKHQVLNELLLMMRPELNGRGVGMFPCGSMNSYIASTQSNLDIIITANSDLPSDQLYDIVTPCIEYMFNLGSVKISSYSGHSVKIEYHNKYGNNGYPPTPVTFHFTKRTAYFSNVIEVYSRMDRRFPRLFLYLKKWAATVFQPSDGVSSYVLSSLLIHYLHCGNFPPILPCLLSLYPLHCTPDSLGRFKPDQIPITSDLINCNDLSSGLLLIRFFLYFCNFSFDKFIISIRRNGIIHKSSHRENLPLICIEDPYDRTMHLEVPINSDVFIEKMKEALKSLYTTCQLV